MKLVKFSDGTYGIRKGNFFSGYKYLDLKEKTQYWWYKSSEYFEDCKGSEEQVRKVYNHHNVTDEVIT